jgi:FMN phosphatase YigB (HAD superfamily)
MIKALIFDLCGVIVPLDYERRYAMFVPHSPYSAEEIPQRIGESGLIESVDTGKLTPQEFAKGIAEVLKLNGMGFDEFCHIWDGVFQPPETLLPEEFLVSLREKCKMVLLSNTNPIHFSYIREHYALVRHFDDYVLSYQVGARKPAAKMYEEAVARAGCRPEECLFIDDLQKNVEAARQQGIRATQFQSYEQIQGEIEQLLCGA